VARQRRTRVIRFTPADKTLYGRALEIAVQGKTAVDPLPLTAGEITSALSRAEKEGTKEGWYKRKPGSQSNSWDVAYEFATRRDVLASVAEYGYTGMAIAAAGGYFVTKGLPPRIELPDPSTVRATRVRDLVPDAVRAMVPRNEQGILARVGESGILRAFLRVQATVRIVAHWGSGNAEMDEVYVAIDRGRAVLVPVEAKSQGRRDALSRPQFTRAVAAMHATFPNHRVRPVGVKVIDRDSFFLVEFNETEVPDQLRAKKIARYVFVEPPAS
jgi:hypothetical protein